MTTNHADRVCPECGNDDVANELLVCSDCALANPYHDWLDRRGATPDLFDYQPISVANMEIHPGDVEMRPVSAGVISALQPRMSKAIWRPAPGRKMAYVVSARGILIGLIFLASPVINLAARDAFLGIGGNPTTRGHALREVMDVSVCVSAQPIGWHWNLGKLMAMLARTTSDEFERKYGDRLRWLTTTSLWGRSSQYNRIYRFLGKTKGHGHQHVSDDEYRRMLAWMRDRGHAVPSCRFGSGSNARMRRIAAYRRASGDSSVTLKHGGIRGVYIAASIPTASRSEVIEAWHSRWGLPRYHATLDRNPPYRSGLEGRAA